MKPFTGGSSPLADLIESSGLVISAEALESATGSGMDSQYRFEPERVIGLLASSIAQVHATPLILDSPADPDDFGSQSEPWMVTTGGLVERARVTLELPESQRPELSPAYSHMTRDRLVEILDEGAQGAEARSTGPVLIQGIPTLGNLRFAGFDLLGFSDWSNACVADPYLDLALACRDILEQFGTAPIRLLLEGYSSEPLDPVRLDWFTLATELVP